MKPKKERLLFVKTVAEELGCSLSFVYKLIEIGELKAFRLGNRQGYRIRESDLKSYMKSCQCEAS